MIICDRAGEQFLRSCDHLRSYGNQVLEVEIGLLMRQHEFFHRNKILLFQFFLCLIDLQCLLYSSPGAWVENFRRVESIKKKRGPCTDHHVVQYPKDLGNNFKSRKPYGIDYYFGRWRTNLADWRQCQCVHPSVPGNLGSLKY